MMGVQSQPQYTTLSDLAEDIMEIMKVYRSNVLDSIEKSIDTCGDIFIEEAKSVSPVDTGEYKRSWAKKKLRKAKYVIYVGNMKKVRRDKKHPEPAIPLINILEFSEKPEMKKCRHVGKAVANSKDRVINTIADAIEKESK